MPIVIVKRGQEAKKVKPTPVTQEDRLQKYIQENPDLIPLDELREDLRLFVIAREFQTSSGPVDVLAVDDEGGLYIIETKLYKNPDKRLVIAQVLDYGAALWSRFRESPDVEAAIDEVVREKWGAPFREKLREFLGVDEEEVASVLNRLQADIRAGRFTFIVLMDRLHERLKDLIAFLNMSSGLTVLACEVEFYRHEDWEIAIPKLYGAETRKAAGGGGASGARKRWDEEAFFEELRARVGVVVEEKIREFYDYVRRTADQIAWGKGRDWGSFGPKYERISPRSLFTVWSDGRLTVNFGWLEDQGEAAEFRKKLKDMLTDRLGLRFPQDYERKWPSFKAEQWVGRVRELIEGLDELIGRQAGKGGVGES